MKRSALKLFPFSFHGQLLLIQMVNLRFNTSGIDFTDQVSAPEEQVFGYNPFLDHLLIQPITAVSSSEDRIHKQIQSGLLGL